MDGLPNRETCKVEQFVRFGRMGFGQTVVEKAMDGLFQHPDREKRSIKMPNPKKRHSSCKRGNRRSHDALARPAFSACPDCGEPKKPHNVCPASGDDRGGEVGKKG